MAKSSFSHPIYEIAHPIVRRLIENLIEIRKFKACFPAFYSFLIEQKQYIKADLTHELECTLIKCHQYKEDELKNDINTLLNDRRLLDNMIGYIQTGKLASQDEYLIRNMLNIEELFYIYKKVNEKFLLRIEKYGNDGLGMRLWEQILKQLEIQEWYLPNLIPDWEVKDLLKDYMVIFFNYHRFDNDSKVISNTNSGLRFSPDYDEIKESISLLFKYDRPLINTKKSFIEHYNNEGFNESFLKLNVGLNEDPDKMTDILTDYILMYQSVRFDYFKEGKEEKNYSDFSMSRLNEVSRKILSLLDDLNNKGTSLDRADGLISALISFIYFDEYFESKVGGVVSEIENINKTIWLGYLFFKESNFDLSDDLKKVKIIRKKILDEQASYNFKLLIDKIYEIFTSDKRFDVERIKKGKGSSQFTHLKIQLNETNLIYYLPIHALSDRVDTFISNFYSRSEKSNSESFLGVGDIFTAIFGRSIG